MFSRKQEDSGGARGVARAWILSIVLSIVFPLVCQAQAHPEAPAGEPAQSPAATGITVDDELTVTAEKPGDYQPGKTQTLKSDAPLLLTPQAVQIVPRAVLEDQRALTLTEAVRNVAGTSTDFSFNGASQPLLILRGFPSSSMSAAGSMSGSSSYYVDGTKVQGIAVSLADVDRVEVVKGPASVLYGRAEPGGLVNVVSREPSARRAFRFEQSVGSDDLLSTTLDGTGNLDRDGKLSGRLAASYTDTGSSRDFVVNRNRAIGLDLRWQPSDRTSLTFSADDIDQRYRNDYGVPAIGDRPADLPRDRQFNDAPELSRIRSTSIELNLDVMFSPGWRFAAKALDLGADTKEVDVWPYRLDLATFEDCLASRNELCRYYFSARPDGEYELQQFQADLFGDLTLGSVRHQVVIGVDAYHGRKEGTTYLQILPPVNVFDPVLGNSPRLDPALSISEDRRDDNRWTSVYLQDQVELGSSVQLVAALRYDRTSAIYAVEGVEPNRESFLTPRLGLVYQAGQNQALYAQYQQAISANNGRDPLTLEALEAEKAEQFELGHKMDLFGGRLLMTTSVYRLIKKNLADYSLFPRIQTVGEARSQGLEIDLSGRVSRRLSVISSYAYTDSEVTSDPRFEGTRLANVPKHSGSLWARFEVRSGWAGGAGIFAQGRREGDQANTFQLPGYARVDLMAAHDFTWGASRATMQVNLENVFDRRYYSGSHQFVQDWIQVGRARTYSATFRIRY